MIAKTLKPWNLVPRGYGLAWVNISHGTGLFLPIPLNIAARLGWLAWQWARYPFVGWEPPHKRIAA